MFFRCDQYQVICCCYFNYCCFFVVGKVIKSIYFFVYWFVDFKCYDVVVCCGDYCIYCFFVVICYW